MELTKQDTKMTKGLAIIFMLLLHLFCKTNHLPYECIKIRGIPLAYYIGLFGDQCVAIFCFCSGYALYSINEKFNCAKNYYKNRTRSIISLLINYWIVVVLFSIVGLLFDKSGQVPHDFCKFLKNFFFIENSYNGAWWFVLTYILLVAISRSCYIIVKKLNPFIAIIAIFGIYLVAYIQRINIVINLGFPIVDWILRQLALLGTSLFPFVIAMLFYKYRLFTYLKRLKNMHFSNSTFCLLSFIVVVGMIVAHGIVPSLIVAPFTGLLTVVLFNLIDKGKIINKLFEFFGEHSTNIWLVHMFFYYNIFINLVFIAKYPLFIFIFMMILSIASSYIINIIYKLIMKLLFKNNKIH